jgi:hypothetical protein
MQEDWIAELDAARGQKPHLDLVLTHVDDLLDTGIREAIGTDAGRVLPLLDTHAFTFLIEDPATVWHLGPQRYQSIAESYGALTPHREKLGIDINIVDRYQNVYPTKQQTGIELFELVHHAGANFQRVALYFENSLAPPDLKLLPSASATVTRIERMGPKTIVDSASGVGLPWKGPAMVDGELWPAADEDTVWLPAGPHSIEPTERPLGARLVRLNAELKAARAVDATTIEFSYQTSARAIAILDRPPLRTQIDGVEEPLRRAGPNTILLPRGQHVVTIATE